MHMKRTMAAVLTAAMLLSGGVAAMAAEKDTAADSPVISTEQVAPSTMSTQMEVTEVAFKSGEYSFLVAKEVLPEGSQETAQEIRLNLGDETVCIDSKTGLAANAETAIQKGDIIYATYSVAMTRSIPPQSFAHAIVVNLEEKASPAHYLVAEQVTKNEDGSVTVLAGNGSVLVTVGKDTPISPYETKNTVKNTDIEAGSRFFAWYDIVTMSMPGQAHATRAVLLPAESGAAVAATDAGDTQQPWTPGQTAPYRFSTMATITDITTEAGDSDALVTKSYTLQSADEKLGTFVANVDENTLLIDDATGQPYRDTLKKGDSIYVYYGPTMTASEPAQVSAEAILVVNLSRDRQPARMLTVERVERNADGSIRLLGDNGGIWVTVGKDTPVEAFKTKNIVKNTDLFIGTTVLAWYNTVAESQPAQATANKVVVLPNKESTFTVITGGDIAVAEGKVEDGIAMVPLRAIAESLGFTVTWDGEAQSIKLKNDKIQTTIQIGSDNYFYATAIEGMVGMSAPTSLGAPAYEEDGVSYVPAELFNLLGATVSLHDSVMYL